MFSNNHSTIHADYFSGWEQIKLQQVLDNCHNEGDAALPNFFCEDHLTYRDRKETGRQGDDSDIAASLDLYKQQNFEFTKTCFGSRSNEF